MISKINLNPKMSVEPKKETAKQVKQEMPILKQLTQDLVQITSKKNK